MSTRDQELTTPDGPMRTYEALPGGEPRGAVVVIQEAFGVNEHIEDVTRRFAAAVGFYGGGIVTTRFPQFPALVDRVSTLQAPWLGLFGDQDGSIPVDDVEQLREALSAAPVATDVIRYADVDHGFHCDARPAYDADAAADAWNRTLAWFGEHLAEG